MNILCRILTLKFLATALSSHAQLDIPYANRATDGALAPPASVKNLVTDLSQAATLSWDAASPVAGNGIYDSNKWAVVFKYHSVSIPATTVVTFKNHPSRAPVVWLVDGDVIIDGTVDLSGEPQKPNTTAEPGPGGYRGGYRSALIPFSASGFGPVNTGNGWFDKFGNSQIVPLFGGHGGIDSNGSGGGGGAILIAAKGTVQIAGKLLANPGDSDSYAGPGSIRIVCDKLTGAGKLVAVTTRVPPGRIHLEALSYTGDLITNPGVIVVAPSSPPLIWPPADAPTVRVVSVGGVNAPSDPRSRLEPPGVDVTFQADDPVQIVIETTNLETNATVLARIVLTGNQNPIVAKAAFQSGSTAQATWVASTPLPKGYSAIIVGAVGP